MSEARRLRSASDATLKTDIQIKQVRAGGFPALAVIQRSEIMSCPISVAIKDQSNDVCQPIRPKPFIKLLSFGDFVRYMTIEEIDNIVRKQFPDRFPKPNP